MSTLSFCGALLYKIKYKTSVRILHYINKPRDHAISTMEKEMSKEQGNTTKVTNDSVLPTTKTTIADKVTLASARKLLKSAKSKNVLWDTNIPQSENELVEPITLTLESLPQPIARQLHHLASRAIKNTLKLYHKNKALSTLKEAPDYIPSSARFKFQLTPASEFKKDQRFKSLNDKCEKTMEEYKKKLRCFIVECHELEKVWSVEKLNKNFGKISVNFSSFIRTTQEKKVKISNSRSTTIILQHASFGNILLITLIKYQGIVGN